MPRSRVVPSDHKPFAALPARAITLGDARQSVAVHVAGTLDTRRLPLICVPGYHRNMADFTDFVAYFQRLAPPDWPVVLVDLKGRGRSGDRIEKADYASPQDAHDLALLAAALGIGQAIFLGQGYGGQVIMALAAERPGLIAGAVLIDAGPVTDSRGLVRLRNNLQHIESARGERAIDMAFRQILGADYPGAPEAQLQALALRTHVFDKRGRPQPLFDRYLLKRLENFDHDDVLVAQWPLFEALAHAPLLLMRTQLTDQLRRQTFEDMVRRRPDAASLTIAGQGSPALLDQAEDVTPIARFVSEVARGV